MSAPNWSKGQWKKQDGIPYVNCGDTGPTFGPVVMAGTKKEMEDCARLMAVAPELYAVLRAMIGMHGTPHPDEYSSEVAYRTACKIFDSACDALDRARGETP